MGSITVVDSSSHFTEREGAQVFVARCMEPGMNTAGAQGRIFRFIHPFVIGAGLRVDVGPKKRQRWLLDRAQSAGLVRQYAAGDHITAPWLEQRNLNLAISAHGAEMVVFMDHTDCGERNLYWHATYGRYPTPEEETRDIRDSLRRAEERFRVWERGFRGVDAPPVHVILTVAVVTPVKAACRRRMDEVLTLSDYLNRVADSAWSASAEASVTAPAANK